MRSEPDCVSTVVEEDGIQSVSSGLRHINRMGFIITEIPCPKAVLLYVFAEGDLKAIEAQPTSGRSGSAAKEFPVAG